MSLSLSFRRGALNKKEGAEARCTDSTFRSFSIAVEARPRAVASTPNQIQLSTTTRMSVDIILSAEFYINQHLV